MYFHHICTLLSKWRERINCIALYDVCPVIKSREWKLPLYGIICVLKRIFIKHAKNSCLYLQLQDRNIWVHSFYLYQTRWRTHSRKNYEVCEVLLSFLFLDFEHLFSNFFIQLQKHRTLMCSSFSLTKKILVFNRRETFRRKFWTLNLGWSRVESHL